MSNNKYQHKLPDWEPCNAIGRAIKRLEEQEVLGIKYPLPETDKYAVVYDDSEHGLWTELLAAYGDNSNVGAVANESTVILNSPEVEWDEAQELCKWLCQLQQYTINNRWL